mgnify:CR=1 FL=1
MRCVGELAENQYRSGLARIEKAVKERLGQAEARHVLRVAVSDEAIACRGATTKIIPWSEISAVKLRYFGSRKSKWRPLGSGFMQLTLKGKGTAMTFESSIEGFDWLAARAAAALSANGHSLDPASASNLIELGIDPNTPSDGCDSPTNVL